ncbi:hypothetical protein BLNAU_17605 [Blattamonas nauphoetae]|uniref:Uncharacterized protein n=1 Tax=Blattamonas nauphoetae TaxID=2049346 RepID=A0ABQ9XB50_9EUKA|nr:hypothetical protein BLNAU_17605 [Blattamonas nauphoetae]
MSDSPNNQRVFLRKVSPNVTEKAIQDFINEKFGQGAVLSSVKLPTGNQNTPPDQRRYNCIVGLKSSEQAEQLVKESPITIDGSNITVEAYQNRSTLNSHAPGFEPSSSHHHADTHITSSARSIVLKGPGMQYLKEDAAIRKLLEPYGKISKLVPNPNQGPTRTVSIEFEKEEEAQKAIQELNKANIGPNGLVQPGDEETQSGVLTVEKHSSHTTLYVRGFRPESKDRLKELFHRYGNVIDCNPRVENGKSWAIITMEDETQAQRAIDDVNGITSEIYGRMEVSRFIPRQQRQHQMQQQQHMSMMQGYPQNYMQFPMQQPNYMYAPQFQQPMHPYPQQQMPGFAPQMPYMPQQMQGAGPQQYPQQHRQQPGRGPQNQQRGRGGPGRGQGGNRGNYQQQHNRAPIHAQPPHQQLPPFNDAELEGKDEADKKQTIGEYIYPIVMDRYDDEKAGKITGILIEFPMDVLLKLVKNSQALMSKIEEANRVLDGNAHQ